MGVFAECYLTHVMTGKQTPFLISFPATSLCRVLCDGKDVAPVAIIYALHLIPRLTICSKFLTA